MDFYRVNNQWAMTASVYFEGVKHCREIAGRSCVPFQVSGYWFLI
jgi:hypothetical protein